MSRRSEAEVYPRLAAGRRMALTVELVLLFVVVPLLLIPMRLQFAPLMMPFLVIVSLCCLLVLLRDEGFDRRRLWHVGGLRRGIVGALLTWLVGGAALTVIAWRWRPDLFLGLPRERPALWLAVLVLYPMLSVYPQEIIFRTFLFERYRELLPDLRVRTLLSAVSFALAHLFFFNWIAPALSLLGGLLFARSYARHRSTLLVCVEHGLWGDLLFTIGLGWYFYGGSIGV